MQFYSTCHGDLADLQRELDHNDQDATEVAVLRGRASLPFEVTNKLKRSRCTFGLEALSNFRCDHITNSDLQRFTRFMDHAQWFVDLDRYPQVLVIHPYAHNVTEHDLLMDECAKAYGVKAHIPDQRDSWYWPGRVSMYAFTRSEVNLRWPDELGNEVET